MLQINLCKMVNYASNSLVISIVIAFIENAKEAYVIAQASDAAAEGSKLKLKLSKSSTNVNNEKPLLKAEQANTKILPKERTRPKPQTSANTNNKHDVESDIYSMDSVDQGK